MPRTGRHGMDGLSPFIFGMHAFLVQWISLLYIMENNFFFGFPIWKTMKFFWDQRKCHIWESCLVILYIVSRHSSIMNTLNIYQYKEEGINKNELVLSRTGCTSHVDWHCGLIWMNLSYHKSYNNEILPTDCDLRLSVFISGGSISFLLEKKTGV